MERPIVGLDVRGAGHSHLQRSCARPIVGHGERGALGPERPIVGLDVTGAGHSHLQRSCARPIVGPGERGVLGPL